jgi:lysophospholipase L1-like esterase
MDADRTPAAGSLRRYVAVGDSFTEGLDDPREDGSMRGWADRVADVLATTEPDFEYANLAVRSLRLDAIVAGQVDAAVAMQPDLVTIAGGGNDILAVRFTLDEVAQRFDDAIARLTGSGATTVVFAGFDPRTQLPPGRLFAARTADYNARVVEIADRRGALLVDLWSMPELADARLWSRDRLHLSPAGHAHIAGVVLDLLGRPAPAGWPLDLGPHRAASWLRGGVADVAWSREHMLPWVVRKVRGRAAGDGLTAKYPAPIRWELEAQPSSCNGQRS